MRPAPPRVVATVVAVPFVVGALVGAGADEPRRVLTVLKDPAIVEASGLVAAGGLLVTANDSGDAGRTFVVEAGTGRTVGHATWGEAVDVEALAPLEGDVLVGDLGDNGAARESVSILRVPLRRGESEVDPGTAVPLVYPDGPHDAETLLVDPVSGRVLVASKTLLGGTLYEVPPIAVPPRVGAPAPVEPVRMRAIGSVRALATDGAFFPDGRHLVVRDYGGATVYTWPDLAVAGTVDLPRQPQGESIAVREVDGRYQVLVGSEGQRSEVLRVPLPTALAEAVAPLPDDPASASPGAEAGDPGAAPIEGEVVADRPALPWLLGGGLMLVALALLLRSLRPR